MRLAFVFTTAGILLCSTASAMCFGTGNFRNCTDNAGNSYNVNRFGNTTMVNGYNSQTGSNWHETANTFGNTTTINGNASNGANWNENINHFGAVTTINGMNSRGGSFNKVCTAYGCN